MFMELTKKILVGSLSCALLFGCHLPINSVKYKVPIMTVTPPRSTKRILDVSKLYILHIHVNSRHCKELKFLQRKEVYSIFEYICNRILKRVSDFASENYGSTFTPLKRNDFVPHFCAVVVLWVIDLI